MIWALLAFLGIPIWFIAVILLAVYHNRKKVRENPDIFRFFESDDDGWKRRASYGGWVSDVLIVHKGPGLVGTDAKQVLDVEVLKDLAEAPKKLDGDSAEVVWTYGSSDSQRVAVARSDLQLARGDSTSE